MSLEQFIFRALARINRKKSFIRPRRILHWLGRRAYDGQDPKSFSYKWYTSRRGFKFYLNPYYFLDRSIIAFGEYEPELNAFLERHIHEGMTCFDLGANMGLLSVHMGHRVGRSGAVYSFEPLPKIYAHLSQHIERNQLSQNVFPIQRAVSNEKGVLQIHLAADDSPNQGMASLVSQNESTDQVLEIEAICLDQFVQERKIKKIDFIKLDLQGAELLALQGAERIIRDMRPLLCFEVSPEDLNAVQLNSREFIQKIEALGYTIHPILSNGSKGPQLQTNKIALDFSAEVLCAWPNPI